MRRIALLLSLAAFAGCAADKPQDSAWITRSGEISGFTVNNDESLPFGSATWSRIVHLHPIKGVVSDYDFSFHGKCSTNCGITGHDYDTDGNWDRIFLCGYPMHTNGCNAFFYVYDDGNYDTAVWDPSSFDKGKLTSYSKAMMTEAERALNDAVSSNLRVTRVWTHEHHYLVKPPESTPTVE